MKLLLTRCRPTSFRAATEAAQTHPCTGQCAGYQRGTRNEAVAGTLQANLVQGGNGGRPNARLHWAVCTHSAGALTARVLVSLLRG